MEWIIVGWEIDTTFAKIVDHEILADELPDNWFHILTYDDVVIALAFSQYFVDAQIQPSIQQSALSAIKRQGSKSIMEFRGWEHTNERIDALAKMREFIENAA